MIRRFLKRLYRMTPRGRAETRLCIRLRADAMCLSIQTLNLGHVLMARYATGDFDNDELREERRTLHIRFLHTNEQAEAMAERLGIKI